MKQFKKTITLLFAVCLLIGLFPNPVQAKISAKDKQTISDASQWLCEDMWNNGLCDLRDYYSTKRGSCGQKMNVKNTVKKFNKNYKKLKTYDKKIKKLKGKKYSEMKKQWNKTIKELKKMYKKVNKVNWKKCPYDDDKFNTDIFQDYFYELYETMCDFAY